MNNMFVSQWGIFEIPPDIYAETVWECDEETGQILDPAPIPDNWRFFRWLHEEEIKEGKERTTIMRIYRKREQTLLDRLKFW